MGGVGQRGSPWPRARLLLLVAAVATAGLLAWLALDGSDESANRHGATLTELTVDSDAVDGRQPVAVVVPEGGGDSTRRPLLVFLHGRGADDHAYLGEEMFAALDRLGDRAPIVAFPNGGDHSYWHDRADGEWGRYVVDEVIPEVARRFDADRDRVALGGISMGGFGAYDIARLNPGRFCAIGGHSPALWQTAAETAPGAFDDAEDFAESDVIAAAASDPAAFAEQPVWLDAGDEDPFRPGDEAFTSALEAAGAPLTERTWPGGHDSEYWDSHWRSYMRFYAGALRGCG